MPEHARDLIDLLAVERHAILTGDFSTIDSLAQEKERLALAVGETRNSRDLEPIRSSLAHNQALLKAAIDGVASARQRIEAVSQAQAKLSVYSPLGVQTIEDQSGAELSKKA